MDEVNKITLTKEDYDHFMHTLSNPPPINDKLKRAFEQYRETLLDHRAQIDEKLYETELLLISLDSEDREKMVKEFREFIDNIDERIKFYRELNE